MITLRPPKAVAIFSMFAMMEFLVGLLLASTTMVLFGLAPFAVLGFLWLREDRARTEAPKSVETRTAPKMTARNGREGA